MIMVNSVSIWSGAYWQATAERAIATAAQSALAYVGVDAVLNVLTFDWVALGGIAAGGAVLSVLKSLAVNAVAKNGPGISDAEHINKPLPKRSE